MTADGAAECLYNDCDAETTAWAIAQLGPQAMANFGQTPAVVAWRERPSTYVVCTADQTIHPALQEVIARRCSETVVWPTGHSPFLSNPALVSTLLIELTADAPTR